MRFFRNSSVLALFAFVCLAGNVYGASVKDRNALEKTSQDVPPLPRDVDFRQT
jgi:hypothetical protein